MLLIALGCAGESAATGSSSTAPASWTTPASTVASSTATTSTTVAASTTTRPTTSTTTSTTTTTSVTSTTTARAPTTTFEPLPDPWFTTTNAAFDDLVRSNPAATLTVVHRGDIVLSRAVGATIDGSPATSASPMVVASVSKLVTAMMIARLHDAGVIDVDVPMPWGELGIPAHLAWFDVTPRELLNHSSGMPVVRYEWFDGRLDCAAYLPSLLDEPPTRTRGRWTYSNGNYCALGLLVEHVTGASLDDAVRSVLADPLSSSRVHLATGGQQSTDIEYRPGVARLSRLGGAGTFIISTDDIASMLASVTPEDLDVMTWPGLFVDQYGWGHTGSVDDAVACAWVLDAGRTVMAATVAGPRPATGGALCDVLVPALAADLGIDRGVPDRSPP
jgi:CubicO group peptidase (beta-lactamase class C family)